MFSLRWNRKAAMLLLTAVIWLTAIYVVPAGAQVRRTRSPQPAEAHGQWKLVLNSSFAGGWLNTSVWRTGWFATGMSGPINGNEVACYSSANVTLPGDGTLHMALTQMPSRCGGEVHPYTGSMISTNPKDGRASGGFEFRYGLVEARIYLPAADGRVANWPAVMTLGQAWPNDGEDDILEGLDGTVCTRFHSLKNVHTGAGGCQSGLHGGWYTVAADWEPGAVTWYYNGRKVASTHLVTTQPMYLALVYTASNKALRVAGPATMRISYVRVWQHPTARAAGVDTSSS